MFKLLCYIVGSIVNQFKIIPTIPPISAKDYDEALKKFHQDNPRKKIKNIEKWDHKVSDRWVGREIEYRDSKPLYVNSICYKGRVTQILPAHYAVVEVTYITSFPIKEYGSYKKRYYKKVGLKFPWKPIDKKTLHKVRFMGGRWKHVGEM